MELYVHIPFCVKKCNYCDFLSMPANDTVKQNYIQALKNEITYYGNNFCASAGEGKKGVKENLETIYFGGGTPTALPVEELISVLDLIRRKFHVKKDAEITVEVNPATIDQDGLHKLKRAGFNRVSIGLQSTQNEKLKLLGRVHTYEQFLETYQSAKLAGFYNINIDIMSALPGQTLEEYLDGVQKVIELNPKHVSSYSLIIEEGTPFYEKYHDHEDLLPDEKTDRKMYHETNRMLQDFGYRRYEISNYAKEGYESKHNSGYWKRVTYLGVGLGASSFFMGLRTKNKSDMTEYLNIWNPEAALIEEAEEKELDNSLANDAENKEEQKKTVDLHNMTSGAVTLDLHNKKADKTTDGSHNKDNKKEQDSKKVIRIDENYVVNTMDYTKISSHKDKKEKKKEENIDLHSTKKKKEEIDLHNEEFKLEIEDISELFDEYTPLSMTDAMSEYFFLGLRMSDGVSITKFKSEFGWDVFEIYGEVLEQLEDEELLVVNVERDYIRLTEYGMDVSNWVFEKFLLIDPEA